MNSIDINQLPKDEFGFSGPLRDKLVTAILEGKKQSSTSLLIEYVLEHEALTEVGQLSVVLDSANTAVAVLRQTETKVCRLADVTLEHCIAEGEGYATIAAWRTSHEAFWNSPEFLAELGLSDCHISDDTKVVCDRFELVSVLS